jgi:hypothetical protein
MSERWLDAIGDLDLLQSLLASDPALCDNMAEMGFIKRVPFQIDHNGNSTSKWSLTEAGRNEIMSRYITRSKPLVN